MIELNGMELTIEQVIAVARHNEQVRISEPAKEKSTGHGPTWTKSLRRRP
ncbi:MAG: hypothetical protein ACLU3I_21355 [Acutalibacteraceae bacterium]